MSTVRIHPNKAAMATLRREARKRGTTESGLVAALVRTVARENLWDAIFDGARIDAGATRSNRDGWTPERTAKLQELASAGLTGAQIAGHLKLSRSAIAGKCSRMGIKLGT